MYIALETVHTTALKDACLWASRNRTARGTDSGLGQSLAAHAWETRPTHLPRFQIAIDNSLCQLWEARSTSVEFASSNEKIRLESLNRHHKPSLAFHKHQRKIVPASHDQVDIAFRRCFPFALCLGMFNVKSALSDHPTGPFEMHLVCHSPFRWLTRPIPLLNPWDPIGYLLYCLRDSEQCTPKVL